MEPGWYPDPTHRNPLRWFDGSQWTPQALDGWQRPVVDPLLDTDDLEASAPPPEPPTGPAVAESPKAADAKQKRSRVSLTWRLLCIGVAAGLVLFGFVVHPWMEVEAAGRRVPIGYFEVADWLKLNNIEVTEWFGAYSEGLALLHAVAALLATTAAVAMTAVRGREPRWATFLVLLLFVSIFAAGSGMPFNMTSVGIMQGSGPTLVVVSYIVLLVACPWWHTPPKPAKKP